MATITKVGAVTFTHTDSYSGEVEIERKGVAVKVPMEALQRIVADKVRGQLIASLEQMTPSDILSLPAARK